MDADGTQRTETFEALTMKYNLGDGDFMLPVHLHQLDKETLDKGLQDVADNKIVTFQVPLREQGRGMYWHEKNRLEAI